MNAPLSASLQRVVDTAGKVAVLMGGAAAEREISLKSGNQVFSALQRAGVDATALDWDGSAEHLFASGHFDRYFIALHGRGGEDGQIQALLDLHGLPYTGSGVLGCALAMDKVRSKLTWLGAGLATPEFAVVDEHVDVAGLVGQFGLPLMIKPAREGSSLGISKVQYADEISAAVTAARAYDSQVLAEKFIDGDEYTVAILDGVALPMIKLEPAREFYDYKAKYEDDDTRYLCPCGLDEQSEEAAGLIALKAFDVLDGRGWGRIDFMRGRDGSMWLIELNTVPGMTDHSLVPMAAQAAGLSFEALVVTILSTSMAPAVQP